MEKNKNIFFNAYFLIGIFFLVSVLIRLPNINRPLSKHHEFCTADAMRFMKIWEVEDASKNHFNLICNYPNKADKHINNYTSGIKDSEGNFYYISFGPFAYIFPYFIFKASGIEVSVIAIQIFNLIFHLISCIFIYKIVCNLYDINNSKQVYSPAFFASMIYLFSPAGLWFFCNIYIPEIFSQYLVIIATFLFLKHYKKSNDSFYLFCILFFTVYTDWIGIFLGLTFFILRAIKKSLTLKWLVYLFLGIALPTCLIIWQYSQINGIDQLYNAAIQRFLTRSGIAEISENIFSVILLPAKVIYTYLTGLLPLLLFLIAGIIFLFRKKAFNFSKPEKDILFITLMPALIFNLFFIEASGHDFFALKGAFFMSVLGGIFWDKMTTFFKPKILNLFFLLILILSVVQYYYINPPGEYSMNGFKYDTYKNIGTFIKQNSDISEVIFLKGMDALPQILVYAERNIAPYFDDKATMDFLEKYGNNNGVVFEVNQGSEIKVLKRISLNR